MKSTFRVLILAVLGTLLGVAVMVKIGDWKAKQGVGKGMDDGSVALGIENPPSSESFLQSFGGMPQQRPQVGVRRVESVSAADAVGRTEADDLVLGVEINGAARAYPLSSMASASHEILNDELQDVAIAVTY